MSHNQTEMNVNVLKSEFASHVKYCYADATYRKTLYSPLKKSGFVPEKGSEIFVSSIPNSATVYDLARFFETAGDLFQVKLMMDADGLHNRGYAFITYMHPRSVQKAMATLKDTIFNNTHKLVLQRSANNCRIFVGGIPVHKTKDDVWRELKSEYNITNIVDVIAYRNYADPSFNRGYVFLEFKTHEEASYFRAKYHDKLKLFGRPVVVDWSVPVMDTDQESLNKVKIIFLKHLDVIQSSESFACQIYKKISRTVIEKVYKFKDYAFVHMTTRKHAEQLMAILKDVYRQTTVEISWAKPPNKFTKRSYRDKALVSRHAKFAASLSPSPQSFLFTERSLINSPLMMPEALPVLPQHNLANFMSTNALAELIAQSTLTTTNTNFIFNLPGTSSLPTKVPLLPLKAPFIPSPMPQFDNLDSFYSSPFQMPSLLPNWEVMMRKIQATKLSF